MMPKVPAATSAIRKAFWRIAPWCMVIYVIAYIDRVNVGFAALSMNKELGLAATTFGAANTILFILYTAFEVPSSLLLARFGIRRWLPCIMIGWGIASACTMLAVDDHSLHGLRGLIFFLSRWFPTGERAKANSMFLAAMRWLPSRPAEARFQLGNAAGGHSWKDIFNLPVILLALSCFCVVATVNTIGVLTAVPPIFAIIGMMVVSWSSDRTGKRVAHHIGVMAAAALGWAALLSSGLVMVLLVTRSARRGGIGDMKALVALGIGLVLASSALAQEEEDPILARGKYLVAAGNCISCHTRADGVPFTGGVAFATPFGTLHSTNITPDDETGIGRWTAADLRRALHEGIAPGGRNLFPAFPYTAFAKVTDEDADAIYAYLRSLKAERYTPPANSPAFALRWPMKIWNTLFFKPAPFAEDRSQSAEWNRGAYLVEGLGHCSACHSPRNPAMAQIVAKAYAGGAIQDKVGEGGPVRRWSAVNLTSAKEGLGNWPLEDLAKYLNTGLSTHAGSFGPMNEVIANSLKHLTKADAHAMAVYLRSLPAQDSKSATVTAEQAKSGEAIYKERCATCHQGSGRGGLFSGPPVAGSAVAQADDPAALINVILYGPEISKDIATGAWETMKPFKDVLSDEEVASVANYLRGNWGNRGRPVEASEVARQR